MAMNQSMQLNDPNRGKLDDLRRQAEEEELLKLAMSQSIKEDEEAKRKKNQHNPHFGTQFENMTEEEIIQMTIQKSENENKQHEATL
jgi:hypothetical protein